MKNKKGFTLIELLIVIAIIAVIVAFAAANFVGIRQRARDVKKKSEFNEMKNALRLYYNDFNTYPGPQGAAIDNDINGCGTNGTQGCRVACDGQLASGGTTDGCTNVYMKLLPQETDYVWSYLQIPASDDFCLWTTLESAGDPDIAKSQTKCTRVCDGIVPSTAYVTCAD
jgi:type IV pilus assembly protein PilA